MPTISSDSLARLLGTLPQELPQYDEIYDLTFTCERTVHSIVERPSRASFKSKQKAHPIHLLHVDRESRNFYAKSYFATTTIFLLRIGIHDQPRAQGRKVVK
ncbi:hypothetical protein CLAFUW4_11917 [Fulvia fulva]|uniref:Uncharacterized protein n=1 Tax=Passalora fulva TaxID=5499 RepID=A0A9Q8USU7_PASFU|nr:uncharacterized protein CLAFUR5_10961 [Fulvia fulva]KAK4617807.1 hypothetical protein CLAFUR4_11922 [Fulvia fulva]KAK4618450.1 hypothetical protein CLAFUR0_11934 [Fulvia fulva]UJO21219.1 hypothetical protein CLAFUR5_10961 [Fulvia fulva]WPV18020.1 hypothetical protein CLAFUW4_11917 [Fulvia fulva]WPV33244.1 hypothetical protein CLAFUW7_11924 [Fulvia fulva]